MNCSVAGEQHVKPGAWSHRVWQSAPEQLWPLHTRRVNYAAFFVWRPLAVAATSSDVAAALAAARFGLARAASLATSSTETVLFLRCWPSPIVLASSDRAFA